MSIEHEQEINTPPASASQPTEIKGIVRNPRIFGGKPIIGDHRISVHNIAAFIRQGYTAEQIASEEVYPDLTLAEVYAALHYYYDHKEEIDRELDEEIAYVKARAQEDMSPLAQRLRQHIKERRQKDECSREQGV
ncbi:MAG TPA: DUF433 domain-containing protein [Ktedonobacterales bacterium]|nr:DUF433 domain-containing protein [Ktedonobacterales bacterium]